MNKAARTLAVLSAILLVGGWTLATAFHEGGWSTGHAETLWRIGGLMVYASMVTIPVAAVLAIIDGVQRRVWRRGHP